MRFFPLVALLLLATIMGVAANDVFIPYASNVGCTPYVGNLNKPAGFDVYETSIDTEIAPNCVIFEAVQGKAADGTFRIIVFRYALDGTVSEVPLTTEVYGGAEFEEFAGQLYIAAHNGDRQPQVLQLVPGWGQ
jgi:hypothetical protein